MAIINAVGVYDLDLTPDLDRDPDILTNTLISFIVGSDRLDFIGSFRESGDTVRGPVTEIRFADNGALNFTVTEVNQDARDIDRAIFQGLDGAAEELILSRDDTFQLSAFNDI
ncbi:MAG: hypothetical protein AAF322_11075, partial [Pseudomonadota bacterium]